MNILVKITFLEMFITLIASYYILKKPIRNGALAVVALGFCAKRLQDNFALFPFDVTKGEDVLNTRYMRAATYKPELGEGYVAVIEENFPVPYHNAKQVLIKVEAAAINPYDYKVNTAVIPFVRFFVRKIPGVDVSGIVVSVGADKRCSEFERYDAVFGAAHGSLAQYAVVDCGALAKLPNRLSHNEAAALPVAFLTSLEAFNRAGFSYSAHKIKALTSTMSDVLARKGFEALSPMLRESFFNGFSEQIQMFSQNENKTVVIVGGSGGCGLYGIKLAKLYGFGEIISINSPRNNAVVKEHGATKTVNYRSEAELSSFIAEYKSKADFVYDTVTEATTGYDYFDKLSSILVKTNPKYVAINGRAHNFAWYGVIKPLLREFLFAAEEITGYSLSLSDTWLEIDEFDIFVVQIRKYILDQARNIFELPDSERFSKKIEISTIIKMENTADVVSAYLKLKTQRTVGKIVLIPVA